MLQKSYSRRSLFFTTISFFILTGIAVAEPPPKWVTELEYKEDIIEAVGYSSEMDIPEVSLARAELHALAEMANVLASTVKTSVRDSMKADESLTDGIIEVIYERVTSLYAEREIMGLAIVDHYIDSKTGMAYALARLGRIRATADASVKAKLATDKYSSLLDEQVMESAIKARLNPTKTEFIEATGYASVSDPEKFGSYEKAMRSAELNARAALARQVRASITSSVQQWVNTRKSSLGGDSSAELLYEDMVKAFSKVKLEGSRIMRRYFSKDTDMVYAQAAMDRAWIAQEFSHAAASVMGKSGKVDLKKELNHVMHKCLDVLIEGASGENVPANPQPELRNSDDGSDANSAEKSSDDWRWWEESVAAEGERHLDDKNCFYGKGDGSSRGEAKRRALSNLTAYLGTSVTVKVVERLTATEADSQLLYDKIIRVVSKKDLHGVAYKHHRGKSRDYSLAYVPVKLVLDTLDAVSLYHIAAEALSRDNIPEALSHALKAGKLMGSPDSDIAKFPIYVTPKLTLKSGLSGLMKKCLNRVRIRLIHPPGTDQYGVQLYTYRVLADEKVLYRFDDGSKRGGATASDYTRPDGHSSIVSEDGSAPVEIVPQFILDIESLKSVVDLDYDTKRLYIDESQIDKAKEVPPPVSPGMAAVRSLVIPCWWQISNRRKSGYVFLPLVFVSSYGLVDTWRGYAQARDDYDDYLRLEYKTYAKTQELRDKRDDRKRNLWIAAGVVAGVWLANAGDAALEAYTLNKKHQRAEASMRLQARVDPQGVQALWTMRF